MCKRPLILASCLTAFVSAVSLAAQRGIDFSGSWVLDETQARPAPGIPQRLVVQPPVTTTNARGVSGGGSYDEVAWRDDVLWIYRESRDASGANVLRRGETWRIDDLGRLVISIETRENNEAATTQTLAYRREKQ